MSKLVTAQFHSEADEAKWWFYHQNEIADEFLASPGSQHPAYGLTAAEMRLPLRVLIAAEEMPVVEQQTRSQGPPFDEYAKRLFRDAVQAEELRRAD